MARCSFPERLYGFDNDLLGANAQAAIRSAKAVEYERVGV